MAALDSEREREHARKRKERRDSGCTHERKERRPHSEERPPPPPPLHDSNRLETERRAERLSRARRPHQTKRRRPAVRAPRVLQENSGFADDTSRTPSPPPRLDLGALHRQLGRDEPERSWGADEDYRSPEAVPPADVVRAEPPPLTDSLAAGVQPEQRLQKIKKKAHTLKKNILKYESDYEAQHGCSLTQADRMTDAQLVRMYEALQRLQEEKRCIKTDPADYALKVLAARKQKQQDEKLEEALKTDKLMADLVLDIEEWLSACREATGRLGPATSWTTAQLSAEKFCVQKALLRLEAARGRPPTHSVERGAARHLYDQYRQVKRALAARSDAAVGALNGELATILEHEPMLFTNVSVDSSSDSQERQSDTTSENTSSKTSRTSPTHSPPTKPEGEELASSNSSAKSTGSDEQHSAEIPTIPSNESLHCLTLDELTKILCETKLQKSVLRRSIKEYELSFEVQNSRKLQKDDKKTKEEDYLKYKAIKARLRLINALMNKQKQIIMMNQI